MKMGLSSAGFLALLGLTLAAQPPGEPPPGPWRQGPGFGGPGPLRPGGPGGMLGEKIKLVERFDKDGDGRLDAEERKAARASLAERGSRAPMGRRGGPWESQVPPEPGRKLAPEQVERFGDRPLYDPGILRTFFLEFEGSDWEQELADFYRTDVEVPARLRVDGRTLEGVGVRFRGQSSYMMVGAGRKRSLNLSLDFVHQGQDLLGCRTLNLLNAHGDPSFLRTVLFFHVARAYLPAPRANFVRLVINGECWGVYVNVQQQDKQFIQEHFGTTKGARWKAPGSPGGRAGLNYLGEDPEPYKRLFEIKTKDRSKSWARLVELCRVLERTPPERLEQALEALLDIEGALRFLALENVLVNSDGYWTRASDYYLYLDEQGRFSILPYDANESFSSGGGPGGPPGMRGPGRRPGEPGGRAPGAPGGPGFPGRGGVELDPLVAASDPGKPLLSKLLAVPALKYRYLRLVHEIATTWLDWERLGPLALHYQRAILAEVPRDTRKLYPTEAFLGGIEERPVSSPEGGQAAARPGPMPGRASASLKSFAEKRRAYLLAHPEVQRAMGS